jgi:hypothetical protein
MMMGRKGAISGPSTSDVRRPILMAAVRCALLWSFAAHGVLSAVVVVVGQGQNITLRLLSITAKTLTPHSESTASHEQCLRRHVST